MASKRDALIKIYNGLNHPMKLGPKYSTYDRDNVQAMLDVIKQLIELEEKSNG